MRTLDKETEIGLKPLLLEIEKLPTIPATSKMLLDHRDNNMFPFTTIANAIDYFSSPLKELNRMSFLVNVIDNNVFAETEGSIMERAKQSIIFANNFVIMPRYGNVRSTIERCNLTRPSVIFSARGFLFLLFPISKPHTNGSAWEQEQVFL